MAGAGLLITFLSLVKKRVCYSVALHKRLVSAPVHAGYCYLTVTQTPPFQKNPVSAPADQYAFDIIIGTFLA